jgi:hypothetical protein
VRRQLRPFYSQSDLSLVYCAPYSHRAWPDHVVRVARTAELLAEMAPESVADLSCGDGEVVIQAGLRDGAVLGDMAPGWPHRGPIEQTIQAIPDVDVFVCSETIEHVQDPDALLVAIRGKARRLLLSTPIGEDHDLNPQHYWGWDVADVEEMLHAAGWAGEVEVFEPSPNPYYAYQIWRCT